MIKGGEKGEREVREREREIERGGMKTERGRGGQMVKMVPCFPT